MHKIYKKNHEIQKAGRLLMSRFFQNDIYSDRKDKNYWLKFSFPFWFTDLISALDSLANLEFSYEEEEIKRGLNWFVEQQDENGGWNLTMLRSKDKALKFWLNFLICRIFKKFYK